MAWPWPKWEQKKRSLLEFSSWYIQKTWANRMGNGWPSSSSSSSSSSPPDLALLKALSLLCRKPKTIANSPSAKSKLQHRQVILRIKQNSIAMTLVPKSFCFPQFCGGSVSRTLVTPWASGISVFHGLLRYCSSGKLRYLFLEFTKSVSMPGMRVRCKCKASCRNLSHHFFTFEFGFSFWNCKYCPT